MFFDAFPRFYESSNTGAYRGRLNLRYEAIFGENQDLFPGARVIDIASHDGRWSLAALKAGAAEVTGIEAREDLVRAALDNVGHYYNDTGRYEFIAGDVFEIMSETTFKADVVLCLGFLYHTLRYNELMSRIREINPSHLIIDTQVLPRKGRVVGLRTDRVELQRKCRAKSLLAPRQGGGRHAQHRCSEVPAERVRLRDRALLRLGFARPGQSFIEERR
jgi:hypothetical protein